MANALKYSIDNKDIIFSTKSLSINGKEYLYKDITAIKHSSAKCLYLFKVDGKWHELRYDNAHKKGVTTIFKKVADHLAAVKKAKAAKEVDTIAAALESAPEPAAEETATDEKVVEVVEKGPAAVDDAPSLVEALEQSQGITAEFEETPEEEAPAEEESEEVPAEETEEAPAEEETPAEAETTAEEEVEKTPEEVPAEEAKEEALAEEPDKKAKKKKAFIIFAAIIALFIIAGIAYFFTIGLPSETSPADGQDTTHQYNDIDELIDEMQE